MPFNSQCKLCCFWIVFKDAKTTCPKFDGSWLQLQHCSAAGIFLFSSMQPPWKQCLKLACLMITKRGCTLLCQYSGQLIHKQPLIFLQPNTHHDFVEPCSLFFCLTSWPSALLPLPLTFLHPRRQSPWSISPSSQEVSPRSLPPTFLTRTPTLWRYRSKQRRGTTHPGLRRIPRTLAFFSE